MCTRIIKFFLPSILFFILFIPTTKVFADTLDDLKNTYNGIESSLKSSYKSTQQSVSLEQTSLPTFFKIANSSNPSQADIDAAKKELSDWNSKIPTGVMVEWGKVSTTPSGFQRIDNADGIEGKTVITEPNGIQHISNLLNGEQEKIYDSTGKDITADYATIQKLSGGNVASVLTYPDASGNFQLFPEKTTTSNSNTTSATTRVCNNGTCTYTMLAPIKGLLGNSSGQYVVTQDSKSLCSLLNEWFRIGIALAGMLAVVMIVLGGFQYATTDSLFDKSEGKDRIQNALYGLLLALTTWLILSTINPALTKCELNAPVTTLSKVDTSGGSGGTSGNPLVSSTNTSGATQSKYMSDYNTVLDNWTDADQTALDGNDAAAKAAAAAKWDGIQTQIDDLNTKYATQIAASNASAGPANQKILDKINSGGNQCTAAHCFAGAEAEADAAGVKYGSVYQSSNYIVNGNPLPNSFGEARMPIPGEQVDYLFYTDKTHADPQHTVIVQSIDAEGNALVWDWKSDPNNSNTYNAQGLRSVQFKLNSPNQKGDIGRIYTPSLK